MGARALRYTMAQTALRRHDERTKAVVDVVSEVVSMEEPRKRLAGLISGSTFTTTSVRDIRCLDAACLISTS